MYTLPAGLYTIGDPCYYFSDKYESREEFLSSNNFPGEGCLDQEGKIPVVVFDTLYGDGNYFDNDGNEYGVDSGTIGIIPHLEGEKIPHSHTQVYFTDSFVCYQKKGVLHFGNYIINTAEEESNEEEGFDYDEY